MGGQVNIQHLVLPMASSPFSARQGKYLLRMLRDYLQFGPRKQRATSQTCWMDSTLFMHSNSRQRVRDQVRAACPPENHPREIRRVTKCTVDECGTPRNGGDPRCFCWNEKCWLIPV